MPQLGLRKAGDGEHWESLLFVEKREGEGEQEGEKGDKEGEREKGECRRGTEERKSRIEGTQGKQEKEEE